MPPDGRGWTRVAAVAVCAAAGLGVTAVLLLFAVLNAGAAPGSYFLARIFFPYSILLTSGIQAGARPALLLAFAQYPLYGALIGLGMFGKESLLTTVALPVVHITAVVACLDLPPLHFE